MLSICMDASQVVLNSVDCTGVINACDDLTASEYDAEVDIIAFILYRICCIAPIQCCIIQPTVECQS